MEYVFKTLCEAWSILYDDLGNDREVDKFELSDVFKSKFDNIEYNESFGISIKILEPQNCLIWSKIRKLNPSNLAKEYFFNNIDNKLAKTYNSEISSNLNIVDFTVMELKNNSKKIIYQIPLTQCNSNGYITNLSTVQFLLKNNTLYSVVYTPEYDMFSNNITLLAMLQMEIASKLNANLGWYKHMFGHLLINKNNFVKDFDEYIANMKETYITGKEGISYFKFYDTKNYVDILNNIKHDFHIFNANEFNLINKNDLLCDELKYMFENCKK